MNEYETDPQRHESSPSEEQSHRPADASHASSSPERGQSDITAQQPMLSQPAAPQSGVPQSGVPQSGVPQSGVPQSGAPQSGAPEQHTNGWLASPWQRGAQLPHPAQHPGQPLPYGQQPYGAGHQQ